METFERFMLDNYDILKSIPPLSEAEKSQIQIESKFGFKNFSIDQFGRKVINRIICEAKRLKRIDKCPVLGTCAIAIGNKKSSNYATWLNGPIQKTRAKATAKKQLMDYEKAKRLFWTNYLKDSFVNIDHPERSKAFVIDENNKNILEPLIKYFIQDPSGPLDLNKGICIFGGVGTGKSNLMQRMSEFLEDYELETAFKFVSMRNINKEVDQFGLAALDKYMVEDICFDDIAVRQTVINSHGTKIMPVDELIDGRNRRFKKKVSRPTHFTSNLDFNPSEKDEMEKLLASYDRRSIDRMQEMCNFLYLGGLSRRDKIQ